jgi:hypothetical protein
VSELKENEYEINAHNNVSLKPYQGAGEENSINGDIGQINRSYDSNHKDSQQTVETTNIDTVLDDAPRTSREISVLPDVTSEIEVDDGERKETLLCALISYSFSFNSDTFCNSLLPVNKETERQHTKHAPNKCSKNKIRKNPQDMTTSPIGY